jgi:hypothetical protein
VLQLLAEEAAMMASEEADPAMSSAELAAVEDEALRVAELEAAAAAAAGGAATAGGGDEAPAEDGSALLLAEEAAKDAAMLEELRLLAEQEDELRQLEAELASLEAEAAEEARLAEVAPSTPVPLCVLPNHQFSRPTSLS